MDEADDAAFASEFFDIAVQEREQEVMEDVIDPHETAMEIEDVESASYVQVLLHVFTLTLAAGFYQSPN